MLRPVVGRAPHAERQMGRLAVVVVEPVAELADDLAEPEQTEVAVAPQQLDVARAPRVPSGPFDCR